MNIRGPREQSSKQEGSNGGRAVPGQFVEFVAKQISHEFHEFHRNDYCIRKRLQFLFTTASCFKVRVWASLLCTASKSSFSGPYSSGLKRMTPPPPKEH